MTEKEWAEAVVKARGEYADNALGDEETKRLEKVAFTAGAVFALSEAGADSVELCNEFAHRCGDL